MNILINTSNLYFGGGVQVAISFINELRQIPHKHNYLVLVSPVIYKQLEINAFPKNFRFMLIKKHTASLSSRLTTIKNLNKIEQNFNPTIVFSVFGPTYWRPKAFHIMGFALPWIVYQDYPFFKIQSLFEKVKAILGNRYRSYYIKRDADYLVVETSDVKNRLSRILNIEPNNISVVGNTYSSLFDLDNLENFPLPPKSKNTFRMVTISHNYAHKNLAIIAKIIPLLISKNIKFEFVVTIDSESYENLFSNFSKYVINTGPIDVKYCPSLYKQSDALFLPTLLECFSASYPEAMKMNLPILTSDYSFAHDICKDAALYFDPLDPQAIANAIAKLSLNTKLQESLIHKGQRVLRSFETAQSRAIKYISLCETIGNKKK